MMLIFIVEFGVLILSLENSSLVFLLIDIKLIFAKDILELIIRKARNFVNFDLEV